MAELSENEMNINGYHGGFSSDIKEVQLQKCSENDIDYIFSLQNKASLRSDPAVINMEIQQSFGPGNYHLDNMYGCDCSLEKAREVQLNQPMVNFNGGKGWMGENGCLIDNDSKLRENKDKLTNKRYIHQYPQLLNQGFFGKGVFHADKESMLLSGDITSEDKGCNSLSGSTTLPYSLTPMIQKLEEEVQNTKHIVPEDSMDYWVRGGLPTRQIVRNLDYMRRVQQKK
tara:strand:- start:3914 stop:4597 length:684 start_codon:yes stop_codon:yes gene_type:complete